MSSLIILPSDADQRKTFYALKVQPTSRVGIPHGHLPPLIIAAICLPAAKKQGCVDIVVSPEGMLPRRYSIKSVEEEIRKNPRKFAGWIPRQPVTPAERQRESLNRWFMKGKPGEILVS